MAPPVPGRDGRSFQAIWSARLAGRGLAWSGGLEGPEQRSCMVAAHRLAKIPTLADRASESGDCGMGCRVFDPFDRYGDAKCLGQCRYGTHNCRAFRIIGQSRYEAAIDFDDVEWQ